MSNLIPVGESIAVSGHTDLQPFSPLSRKEEADLRIKEYIAKNSLEPGDRLPGESWFASQLGVGRPLIREVFRGLEAVGVIETRKGVGRFLRAFEAESYLSHFTTDVLVQSFSEKDLEETRCLLEIAAVGNAVEQLTDDDCEQIRAFVESMRRHARMRLDDTESDIGMHRVIMSRADNRIIAALLDAVYALTVVQITQRERDQAKRDQDLAEHEAIAAAAIKRDGASARAALIAHFETTASRLGFRPLWRNLYEEGAEILIA